MRVAQLCVRATSSLAAALSLGWAMSAPGRHSTPVAAFDFGAAVPSFVIADTVSDALIALALEHNPFAGISRAEADSATGAPANVVTEQPLRVLGTVVDSAGGSFALCQLGAASAVIVHIGQWIGDYELHRIDKASAVFAKADGGRIELHVSRTGT